MPELPEVEIAARNLRRWAVGRVVTEAHAGQSRVLRPAGPRAVAALVGRRATSVQRRGKNLLLVFELPERPREPKIGVLSHFGMTGKWVLRDGDEPAPPHARVSLSLDDGHAIHYCDARMFGRFVLVKGARFSEVPSLAELGQDPLEDGVDEERLLRALSSTRRPVKVALLDQGLLAGVGNIQASEALFRAGIDPRRPGSSLRGDEVSRLADGVLRSIRDTIDALAAEPGDIRYVEEGAVNPFAVYAREGEPCPHCGGDGDGGTVERIVQAGRATFFCRRCQH